tara:strand:+ start:323 stop:1531 length:1209 start_codon:yes stop_codon:yes gene_type:complete
MAKTIQEQYNQINKGKGSKELFLKEVKRNYPHMIVNSATYKQAEKILLQRSVITENLAGIANPTNTKDWFGIFNKNMEIIKEANPKNPNRYPPLHIAQTEESKKDEARKADASKPDKDVVELEVKGFDYKDDKNVDNLNGEEFRLGVKFEMDKVRDTVSDAELGDAIKKAQELVAKNLAKDPLYYIKNAAFGIDKLGYVEDFPGLGASKSDKMEPVKLKENKMISLINILEDGPLGEKPKAKKRIKKETLDSKLAEIDKQAQIVALETKIAHVDEIIEKKNTRLSMVTEDENLSELADKTKIKAMQREVKDLERRKMKMEKLYEKMSGKSYKKPVVDEDMESSNYAGVSNSDTSERAFKNNANEKVAEESNAGSNENSNDNSNDDSNDNPESYSGLKKFREN